MPLPTVPYKRKVVTETWVDEVFVFTKQDVAAFNILAENSYSEQNSIAYLMQAYDLHQVEATQIYRAYSPP